jgi:hypothetical protein
VTSLPETEFFQKIEKDINHENVKLPIKFGSQSGFQVRDRDLWGKGWMHRPLVSKGSLDSEL